MSKIIFEKFTNEKGEKKRVNMLERGKAMDAHKKVEKIRT